MGKRSTDAPLFNCLRCDKPLTSRPYPGRKYCSRTCAGNTSHGMSTTREYMVWAQMRDRCFNPKCVRYETYGARGITVCERWNSFENFFDDMGPRPTSMHSIERIDNDGNYEPSNCKWGTRKEQSQNRRGNWTPEEDRRLREIMASGATYSDACRKLGKGHGAVAGRARRLGIPTNWDPHALRGPKHSPQERTGG